MVVDKRECVNMISNFLNKVSGDIGEYITKYYLKASTDAIILRDVFIKTDEGNTSQIDIVMIGNKGVYVIEVKSYDNANIYGNGKNRTWYYYLGGKRYDIYSPVIQNRNHIKHLKNLLKDFGDIPFFSGVVILCNDIKVENINADLQNTYEFVCDSMPSLSRALNLVTENKPCVLSEQTKQEISKFIQANQIKDKQARKEHIEKIKTIKAEQETLKQENLCPYCKTPLVLRKGKYGNFYGCSNYPKCKYTRKI